MTTATDHQGDPSISLPGWGPWALDAYRMTLHLPAEMDPRGWGNQPLYFLCLPDLRQEAFQELALGVLTHCPNKPRRHSEPSQGDCRIGWGAAGKILTQARGIDHLVDQHLSQADHRRHR
jgi:hypothetical protein